jgi:hypothetical protein
MLLFFLIAKDFVSVKSDFQNQSISILSINISALAIVNSVSKRESHPGQSVMAKQQSAKKASSLEEGSQSQAHGRVKETHLDTDSDKPYPLSCFACV